MTPWLDICRAAENQGRKGKEKETYITYQLSRVPYHRKCHILPSLISFLQRKDSWQMLHEIILT